MGAMRGFITRNSLPEHYLQQASIWFDPIVETLIEHHCSAGRPLVVGINGCQGSGKTTLADYLCTSLQIRGLKAIAISIDDFYLSRQQRQALALNVHPLLATRGVPGTHDLKLALATLKSLAQDSGEIKVPRFNKVQDERFPIELWPQVEAPFDIIILEGWCVGISAQNKAELLSPMNELERLQDPFGHWRQYVNQQLETEYPELWQLIDRLIMLQAPSFSCVYQWRLEQEQKLEQQVLGQKLEQESLKKLLLVEGVNAKKNRIMHAEEILQFIQHYERLTRHSLKYLPETCQHLFQLTHKRQIAAYQAPNPLPDDPRFGQHEVRLKGSSNE
jgi:D-glycerate 3-kinase